MQRQPYNQIKINTLSNPTQITGYIHNDFTVTYSHENATRTRKLYKILFHNLTRPDV